MQLSRVVSPSEIWLRLKREMLNIQVVYNPEESKQNR